MQFPDNYESTHPAPFGMFPVVRPSKVSRVPAGSKTFIPGAPFPKVSIEDLGNRALPPHRI